MPIPRDKITFPEAVKDLAQNLILPDETIEPLRYAGEGNGTKTAAQCLKQEFELVWDSAAAGNGNQLPVDEMQWFVFRNAVRSAVYLKRAVNAYTYRVVDQDGNDFTYPGIGSMDLISSSPHTHQTGDEPHGDALYAAEDHGKFGVWVDNDGGGGQGIRVTAAAAPLATTWFRSYYHDGKSWVPSTQFQGNGALTAFTFQAPAGGAYMYIEVFATALDANTFTVTTGGLLGGPFAVWAHNAVPNFTELLGQGLGIRVLGAVGWFRNESSDEFANGKIIANTMAKAFPWSNIASGSNQVAQTVDYYSGLAKYGHYAFLVPDDGDDFTMENDLSLDGRRFNSQKKVSFPLRERSPYITGTFAANNTARDVSLIVWHHVEYETTSKLVERRYSKYSEDQWRICIEFLKRIPHHYENKFHFDTIMGYLGKYGAPIGDMLGEVLKAFPQTAMVGNILQGERLKRGFQQIEGLAEKRRK